jgi:hypothetical protein
MLNMPSQPGCLNRFDNTTRHSLQPELILSILAIFVVIIHDTEQFLVSMPRKLSGVIRLLVESGQCVICRRLDVIVYSCR